MDINQYQKLADRTLNGDLTFKEMRSMCALGLAGEAGECADYVKKVLYHGHEMDKTKLKAELGDVLWYVAGLATLYEIKLSDVAIYNVNVKLKKRYPDGFSEEMSINRKDDECDISDIPVGKAEISE